MRQTLAALLVLPFLAHPAWAQVDAPPPPPPPPLEEPAPAPTVAPPPAATPRATPAPAPDGSPVVRATTGNLGMFFRFGGLATLDSTNNTRTVNGLVITQVGLKLVINDSWMLPIYFGTGVQHSTLADCVEGPGVDCDSTDAGFDGGVGFEYHFRVWRRISPFIGGSVGIGYVNPAGDDNYTLGIGLGPWLGVEYYIADRVSLTALYMLVLQIAHADAPTTGIPALAPAVTTVSLNTLAGGALNLTYYF